MNTVGLLTNLLNPDIVAFSLALTLLAVLVLLELVFMVLGFSMLGL